EFENEIYHLRVHGPNGFFRDFIGSSRDPILEVSLTPVRSEKNLTGEVELRVANRELDREITVVIDDSAYGKDEHRLKLGRAGQLNSSAIVKLDLAKSYCWYDVRISVLDVPDFRQHYAGRIETGREGWSDPLMGRQKIS